VTTVPRWLVLDLTGVVCLLDHPARLAALAADCDATPEQLYAAVWESGLDNAWDAGGHSADEIQAVFRERFGYRGDRAAFERAWVAGFLPDERLLTVVDGVHPSVGRAILSDNGPVLFAAMPRLLPQVWHRFDPVLFSCELGAVKPDPAIFRAALDRLGCAPADVLFLDDRPTNVTAARGLGLAAETYVDARQAADRIRAAGLNDPA
jgi:glucose-1-phosphatase